MRTRRLVFALLCALCAALAAPAQVSLRIRLAHASVLDMEPAVVAVTIQNDTPQDLVIGGTNAAVLQFDIEESPGTLLRATGKPVLAEEVAVPARGSRTVETDLVQPYLLRKPGPYTVTAIVRWNDEVFASNRDYLDVLPGLEIRRLQALTSEKPPSKLTYSLRTLGRERHQYLFLRVDNEAKSLCYGVYDLGTVVRMFEPQVKFDNAGRIHILHQSAPTRFTHSVFETDGVPVSTKFHGGKAAMIKLVVNREGEVKVEGGDLYRGDSYIAPLRASETRTRAPVSPSRQR